MDTDRNLHKSAECRALNTEITNKPFSYQCRGTFTKTLAISKLSCLIISSTLTWYQNVLMFFQLHPTLTAWLYNAVIGTETGKVEMLTAANS